MRSSNNYRNGSNISRMVIKEESEEDIERHLTRTRMDPYALSSSSGPPTHFSKTSIIRTHHGKRKSFFCISHLNLLHFIKLISSFFCLDSHEDYSLGLCGYILLILSYALICLTFPFSLTVCLKVSLHWK